MLDITYKECWEQMRSFAPKSISWNHYDLANNTVIQDSDVWKEFLQTREVVTWLDEEQTLLQNCELKKLSSDVAGSRSVGQAQLINAMDKIVTSNKSDNDTGPTFIYTYIPLTVEQKHAPNVVELTEDIFYEQPTSFEFSADNPPIPKT